MLEALRLSTRPSGRYSYALSAPGREEMVHALMLEHPILGTGRYGCYMIPGTNPYSDIARSVECEVFQHFFGNTDAVMQDAYGQYEHSSLFFLVIDLETGRAAGTLRVIANSEHGLKTLNDIAQPPLSIPAHVVCDLHRISSLDKCWDIGTLAVLKDYRGRGQDHQVGTLLYGVLHREALRAGVHHAVTILDRHAYAQLTQMLAIPFQPIANSQPFDYLGSQDSRAAYLHFPNVVPSVESHLGHLDEPTRNTLRPYVARVIYAEGVPDIVSIPPPPNLPRT